MSINYLVTGSCGTVGKEIIRQLLRKGNNDVDRVVGIDNNESELFFQDQFHLDDTRAHFFLSDIRDRESLIEHTKDVDIVFHVAALKHVVLCERSPLDSVQTNIIGLQNVVAASRMNKVSKVVFTSSDKAVNPTNVMGTSKLMGERLITAANAHLRDDTTIFVNTRFGNVLGSAGSVVPIFYKQISKGGPVTITDPKMTRFVMSIEQAVKLVVRSAEIARGGEVFITKMPVVRIIDLAKAMISELAPKFGFACSDIETMIIGSKPGEKQYEELMSGDETKRAIELGDYFVVTPAFRNVYREIDYIYKDIVNITVDNPYISEQEKQLTVDEIIEFLLKHKVLDNLSMEM